MLKKISWKPIAIILIFSTFIFEQAIAGTHNRIDYKIPVYISGQLNSTQSLELFTRSEDGELQNFWTRLEIRSHTATQKTNVFIKHFPLNRYRAITKRLRKGYRAWPKISYDRLGLCDSNARNIRFKNKRQAIIDVCGFTANNIPKVKTDILLAEQLLEKLVEETYALPDMQGTL